MEQQNVFFNKVEVKVYSTFEEMKADISKPADVEVSKQRHLALRKSIDKILDANGRRPTTSDKRK